MIREKESPWEKFFKYLAPPLLVFFVLGLMLLVIKIFGEDPDSRELPVYLPNVEVVLAKSENIELKVKSYGTVKPRIETLVLSEVSGLVEEVSPKFYPGGFFKEGDVLLRIDDTEYIAAVANAKGMVALAKLGHETELALSKRAQDDWDKMGKGGSPSALVLRKPHLNKAEADMASAMAMLALAERNLRHTTLTAPYDGRVSEKFVDVGQTVGARMTQLGRIYSVDFAEIRLPVSVKEAGYLSLSENGFDETAYTKPSVTFAANYGSEQFEWKGVIDRVEGTIDPKTRQLYLVGKVEDPYGLKSGGEKVPLKVGLFVEAEVSGKNIGQGFVIPRAALRSGVKMYVIGGDNRLKIKDVTIAQYGIKTVIVTDGLEEFDRVCLTALEFAVEGMEVEVEESDD